MNFQSAPLTLAARTSMRICPGPACGSGASPTLRTSGPPYSVNWRANTMIYPFFGSARPQIVAQLLLVDLPGIGGGECSHERLGGHLDPADHLHPLFAFLLPLKQLPLPSDVAAITLGQYVLADCPDSLACDHPRPDGRLNGNLELLPGNQLLQLGRHRHAI